MAVFETWPTRRDILRGLGIAAGTVTASHLLSACQAKPTETRKALPALTTLPAQGLGGKGTEVIRPEEIQDVLVNPGIGFMTFQRFNGDSLNEGTKWTEGYPIKYEPNRGSRKADGYPETSLAYFRIYWRFLEPIAGEYQWEVVDKALQMAGEHGQTLLLRIAPYGSGKDNDVPDWYRALVGSESTDANGKLRTDPENPLYVKHFTRLVRAMGARYNGHPLLESVDLSIVGAWGEGAGSDKLSTGVRKALVDSYLEAFPGTRLLMLLSDPLTNGYGMSKRALGWRADCLGDLGGFSKDWCHMHDIYPQGIIKCGLADAWKHTPVSFEAGWVLKRWKAEGRSIDYIIDQSFKWHISSFNAKSSAVPEEWWPQVNRWLNGMGYRFVLRKFTHGKKVKPGGTMHFSSWWENKGVAPCYQPFRLAVRLVGAGSPIVAYTEADIRTWLPGDSLCDGAIAIPGGLAAGDYAVQIALVDVQSGLPRIKLAIKGVLADGWYPMGKVAVSSEDS